MPNDTPLKKTGFSSPRRNQLLLGEGRTLCSSPLLALVGAGTCSGLDSCMLSRSLWFLCLSVLMCLDEVVSLESLPGSGSYNLGEVVRIGKELGRRKIMIKYIV